MNSHRKRISFGLPSLLWIGLFLLGPQLDLLAQSPRVQPRLDLSDSRFYVKDGFTLEDRGGFATDDPNVRSPEQLPVFPNILFDAPIENRVREYTIRVDFTADVALRNLPRPALKLRGVGENWAVYLNGELLREEIHTDAEGLIDRYRYTRNVIVPLLPGALLAENRLVFRVLGNAPASPLSNNIHLGLTSAFGYEIGDEAELVAESDQTIQLILYGVYIFFGLYHLLFYIRRRKSPYNLFFGLFSIVLAGYFLAFSNRAFAYFEDFHVQIFLAYASQPLALGLFLTFLTAYFYPTATWRQSRFLQFVVISNGLTLLAMIFAPYRYYQTCLFAWYFVAAPQLLYVFFFMGRVVYQRLPDGKKMSIGLCSGILFVLWDMLDTVMFNTQIRLSQYGHLLVILSLVAILANRFLAVHNQSERLNEQLAAERNAFARFVPAEFLVHLNRDAIQDIRLGDYISREMTILVADIRNFTTLSETMSPEDNFEFLNNYLGRIGPVIRRHEGFIDKYIGDAIMALFPTNADNAIRAAVEIRRELEEFNAESQSPLDIGIGIHTGNLIMGTIGEEERMEGTVISDAVNQAFRIESLTRTLGASVLISTRTLHQLEDPTRYEVRFLGKIKVKGKNEKISIYELLDGLEAERREQRMNSRGDFEHALFLYYNEEFREAGEILRDLERKYPDDVAISTFRVGCESGAEI